MDYGSPAGLIASLIALDRELSKASPERRDAMLAARTMWEQQITHWDTPIVDPMLAGTVLGLMVGRALIENADDESPDEIASAMIWHLYCVWSIRSETDDLHLALPPDPFGEPHPPRGARWLAVRLTSRLLLRLVRAGSRMHVADPDDLR